MGETSANKPSVDDPTIRLSRGLREIARLLDHELTSVAGAPMLFSLIVWSNKRGARTQYIANVTRPDAVKALEELLERWKSDMPDVPAHEVQ